MNIKGPDQVLMAGLKEGDKVCVRKIDPMTDLTGEIIHAVYLGLYGNGVMLRFSKNPSECVRVDWRRIAELRPLNS